MSTVDFILVFFLSERVESFNRFYFIFASFISASFSFALLNINRTVLVVLHQNQLKQPFSIRAQEEGALHFENRVKYINNEYGRGITTRHFFELNSIIDHEFMITFRTIEIFSGISSEITQIYLAHNFTGTQNKTAIIKCIFRRLQISFKMTCLAQSCWKSCRNLY